LFSHAAKILICQQKQLELIVFCSAAQRKVLEFTTSQVVAGRIFRLQRLLQPQTYKGIAFTLLTKVFGVEIFDKNP
jgi:hypothetical protein